MNSTFKTIEFEKGKLIIINQTKLPLAEEYIKTDDYERIAIAIERLEVRGAPAIGIAAAYGIALGMKESSDVLQFEKVFQRLKITRPTAVNLFWALERMKKKYENIIDENCFEVLINEAKKIHKEDIDKCDSIGKHGLKIFAKSSVVLTHCNTGALATGGDGTAFSVIKKGYENNLVEFVFADETRPLLQGSRLTAFELFKNKIPFKIITDSTAAFLMQQNKIDLVITGADRIAANGDSANKIGTYNLAVLCKHHNIPFYIAAPTTTIDTTIKTGSEINIEERGKNEILKIGSVRIAPEDFDVYSPAFDVTPNNLITGIITENDLYLFPFAF